MSCRNSWDLEHLHQSVQQAVNDLESGCFITPHSSRVSHIACLPLKGIVLYHDICSLKYSDRERMAAILSDGLEESRDE